MGQIRNVHRIRFLHSFILQKPGPEWQNGRLASLLHRLFACLFGAAKANRIPLLHRALLHLSPQHQRAFFQRASGGDCDRWFG